MRTRSLMFEGTAGRQTLTLMIADTMRERMRGLLGRPRLGDDEAMLLPSCGLIHTFGMRYPIDVVYLNRCNVVLKLTAELAPRRVDGHLWAGSVVELAPGTIARCGIRLGVEFHAR